MELVERDDALQTLGDLLDESVGGAGRVALVSGEAGVGKTALVARFVDAHAGVARVLWGACDPLATPRPLGPLFDIAATLGGSLASVRDLTTETSVAAHLLPEPTARRRFVVAVVSGPVRAGRRMTRI